MSVDPQPVLTELQRELGADLSLGPDDTAALAAAATDAAQFRRWCKRRLAGEPLAHVLGRLVFAGRTFRIDKRAYVTDPELIHLVNAVIGAARELADVRGRGPTIAEIGVGCGSLACTVKAALPNATVVGLDLDPDALAVAALNAKEHGLAVRLIESDLFAGWPTDLPPPDLVFGDPPWGDETTLYADDRPASHYHAMPPASAFPLGGATGMHEQILRAIAARGWPCEVWLNGGVITPGRLTNLGRLAPHFQLIEPASGLHLLRCRFSA